MKIMHLLAAGGTGGIETLCKNYAKYSAHDNTFVIVWGKDGATYLEMRKNGADVIQLNASKKRPLQTLKRIDAIRRERKIDAVVVHHAAPLSYLYLALVKKKAGNHIRTITYAHGNAVDMYHIHDRRGRFLRKNALKYTLRNTDQIVAISQSVKESLVKYLNAPEKKICVVYNGVDTKRFNIADLHPFSYPRRLIYVGRLVREKGVQITLKALAGLPEKLEWRFLIIGDGSFRKELEHLTAELNLQGKVQFLGTRSDISRLLEKADIFIHMPIWEEGFGIAVVEAMAAGVLCICADSGAVPEIIRDGENGILIHDNNQAELQDCLEKVIGQEEDNYYQIRKKARETSERYSIDAFSRTLDSVLSNNGKVQI